MKKETLADKLAKKTFFSEDFQKSWGVHMQAFGPILEPAFAEDYQTRIHLTAALNRISRRDVQGGFDKLKSIQKKCVTDADKAAWLFFAGLCFEFAGRKEEMLSCYLDAGEFQHRFYMPYMKIAKFYQEGCLYDRAEEYFNRTIHCFDGAGLGSQEKLILGSAYASLASCLTMMHRYPEAEQALSLSRQIYPSAPGRAAVEAVLYAALDQREKVEESLGVLQQHSPDAFADVRETAEKILNGTAENFCPVAISAEKVEAFWAWFRENRPVLEEKLKEKAYEDVLNAFEVQLAEVFPFVGEPLTPGIWLEEECFCVDFPHYYCVALMEGYRTLLARWSPDEKELWKFDVVSYT